MLVEKRASERERGTGVGNGDVTKVQYINCMTERLSFTKY